MDDNGKRTLVDSLAVLNDRERRVVLGLYVDSKSFRAIALEMNCSPRTVLRLRDSASAKLAEALADEAESLLNPVLPVDEKVPGRRPPLVVEWATCGYCSRQAVPLDSAGLCDICGPVAEATAAARRY